MKLKPTFRWSIRLRLTVLFALVFGTTLTIVAVLCYQVLNQSHQADFDASLYNHAIDVAQATDMDFFGHFVVHALSDDEQAKLKPFQVQRSLMQLRNAAGTIVARSDNLPRGYDLPFGIDDRARLLRVGVSFKNLDSYRLISYLIQKSEMPPLVLQIAAPMISLEKAKSRLALLLSLTVPIVTLISILLGLALTSSAFRPMTEMVRQTARIEVQNLRERITIENAAPELTELAQTLNQLLDRIELAVGAQERFVSDASHQIKTPIAVILGELGILRAMPEHSAEARRYLASVEQETRRMSQLVQNLLILAKMDSGHTAISFQSVRMDEMISEVARRLGNLALQKHIRIKPEFITRKDANSHDIDFETKGDPILLQILTENLVENAIKYSPDRTDVQIILQENKDDFILTVADHGPGIPEEQKKHLFERFSRGARSSVREAGFGLGLAIAQRVAELHGGIILVESALGKGSQFIVQLRKNSSQIHV